MNVFRKLFPTPSEARRSMSFQKRVRPWLLRTFGPEGLQDKLTRVWRFSEESLELGQSLGQSKAEAHALVEYVYGREVGDPPQEVGGTMVTLAAMCEAHDLNMHAEGDRELARVNTHEMVARIRAKSDRKPKFGPLPGSEPTVAVPQNDASVLFLSMIDDLDEAGRLLRKYEAHHRAKGTEESDVKAAVNDEYATRYESTVALARAVLTKAKETCSLPPPGWYCSKEAGHDGPCPTRSVSGEEL